ncbi:MAG: phosphoribosylglycinamide formyltransferase [Muribaculaceae bacterium]|nr:phosphoribosylglycinamide formyltransferase [Muribaculaceae bacterium]
MKNIAVLASGEGSNAEAIVRYFAGSGAARVAIVLSNREKAGVHSRMAALGVRTETVPRELWNDGSAVVDILMREAVDFVVLAGFLCRVEAPIIEAFSGRIVNIHPSLLPKFGGAGMWGHHVHEAVIASGEKESGITVHYVTKEIDGGEIIFQAKCPVEPVDTPETLANRVHALEHAHYPTVIENLLK